MLIENVLAVAQGQAEASFYRTAGRAEIDLERYRLGDGIEAIDPAALCGEIAARL